MLRIVSSATQRNQPRRGRYRTTRRNRLSARTLPHDDAEPGQGAAAAARRGGTGYRPGRCRTTTRNRAKARPLPHDEVEPGHGTALPVQHQLVDARLLEADVAPRAFEAQGVVVRVGSDGAEADALQLPAGRVKQGQDRKSVV